jgi:diguanylate cyclase
LKVVGYSHTMGKGWAVREDDNLDTTKVPDIIDYNNWERKILKSYWIIITIAAAAALALKLLEERAGDSGIASGFVTEFILPSFLMYAALIVAEYVVRKRIPARYYFLLLTSCFVSIIIVLCFPDVNGIQATFVFSIFSAISYFDLKKAAFAAALNGTAFFVVYALHDGLREQIGTVEMVLTIGFLCNSTAMVFGMISRGKSLHRNLVHSMVEKQEMMIRHAIVEKQAKIDALTELYNHKSFHEYLENMVTDADRYGTHFHLAILDIDNFKQINDTYGHWAGDIVLKHVADAVRNAASRENIGARYGGEEFALLLTGMSSEEALQVVEQLRESIATIELDEIRGQTVTASIGLRRYNPGEGKDVLFKGADACLYESKRSGKNRTTCLNV